MRRMSRSFLCGLALLAFQPALQAIEPLAPEQFPRLVNLIKPEPREEKWSEVPWRTSLWQARQEAAARGKPILLWEMDGHPLGCT